MKLINLGSTNSVLNYFMSQIRDKGTQKDNLRFRKNLERIGEIFAYEVSKTLNYENKEIITPLGISTIPLSPDNIVLATILRAGLPLHQGLLNYFDTAQNSFITAYRKHSKGKEFKVIIEYVNSPDINDKVLILADTMLATGISLEETYKRLLEYGTPSHTHFVCPLASIYAIEHLQKNLPSDNITLWVAAIDEELTSQSYIVPGLGDAGDLAYGKKK